VYAFRMWSCGLVGGKRSVLGAASECHLQKSRRTGRDLSMSMARHSTNLFAPFPCSCHTAFHACSKPLQCTWASATGGCGQCAGHVDGWPDACATYGDAGGSRASYGTRPAEAGESGWGCDFRLGSSLPVARDLGTLLIPPAGAMDAQHRRPIQPTWPMSLTGGPAQ
jgi:hypothetical protein